MQRHQSSGEFGPVKLFTIINRGAWDYQNLFGVLDLIPKMFRLLAPGIDAMERGRRQKNGPR